MTSAALAFTKTTSSTNSGAGLMVIPKIKQAKGVKKAAFVIKVTPSEPTFQSLGGLMEVERCARAADFQPAEGSRPLVGHPNDNIFLAEHWVVCEEHKGFEVSDLGSVRNRDTLRILGLNISYGGYATVNMGTGKQHKSCAVHRLVASAFIPNLENKPTVDHKNRVRHDNRLVNLCWATYVEQAANRERAKTSGSSRGIWQCTPSGEKLIFYEKLEEAALNVVGYIEGFKNISTCATGKSRTAFGFSWSYTATPDIENEIWVPFQSQKYKKGQYVVSNFGRIKNGPRLIKGVVDNNGYQAAVGMSVHILVAKTFILNPDSLPVVNHKDGDKLNNAVCNLEWVTYSGNTIHAIEAGLISRVKRVIHVDASGKVIQEYRSCNAAAIALGVNVTSVNKCCKGQLRTCGENKLCFRYKDGTGVLSETAAKVTEKKKVRKVAVIDRKSKLVIYKADSVAEAARHTKSNYKTVVLHCKNEVKHPAGHFTFKYL